MGRLCLLCFIVLSSFVLRCRRNNKLNEVKMLVPVILLNYQNLIHVQFHGGFLKICLYFTEKSRSDFGKFTEI